MALTKINASVIANNTIAVGNIADNSVDATKIASNSILTRHIDDDQVTTDQIAANTIATANIADNAVDGTKIASNSILTRHIDDDQVTGDQLSDNITIAGTLGVTGLTTAAGVVSTRTGDASQFVRLGGSITTGFGDPLYLLHSTTGDMAEGFGTGISFAIKDGGATQSIGDLGYTRAGADNTADFILQTYNGGTRAEKLRITGSGNVGLGDAGNEIPVNDSGGTQPLYLSMHRNAGNLITMSADHSATGELIGGIDFANDNNADAANNDADGKLVALIRSRTYTDDSNSSDDSGGTLQFATKQDGNVLAERMKINQTGEVQIKGQYNSSGNSQFAFKTVYYQFDMDSGGTHYLQVPLYSSYSSSNSSGWAEMDIAWFPDHASHTHLHSYKFMWGSDHGRILNLGVISATANETTASYGPYNITSKSQLFRHPTAGETNMTYLYIKMQGYHAVNKRRVITLRGVATANDLPSIGPVIDHGSTEPVANMVSVNAEIESA
jgi:hypothetical protein